MNGSFRAMRFLPISLLLTLVVPSWLVAADTPTVKAALPDITVAKNAAIPAIDLQSYFEVTSIAGQVVQFSTLLGTFNVELFAIAAPATVVNFLSYVNAGSYTDHFIHRSDKPLQIIQGGSFRLVASGTGGSVSAEIPTGTPIDLETSVTLDNTRGTIAMARGDNSIGTTTSGWFINTGNNTLPLPPASSGGYAVFGRVTGTGMSVVDAIGALNVPVVYVSVLSSSTASPTLTVASTPAGFTTGLYLLGSRVQTINGTTITLEANANRNIVLPTTLPAGQFNSPFQELPATATGDFVTVNSISPAVLLPSTIGVTVITCSTTSTLVSTTGIPPGVGIGSTFLGSTVTFTAGNFIFLAGNANRTITSSMSVPATPATEKAVVTFSVQNSNPSLVGEFITGNALVSVLGKERGGISTIVVTATDSNGNNAQSQYRLLVTGGNTTPTDVNGDGFDDFVFQDASGQIARWFLDGTGNAINFSTGSGVKPGSGLLYGSPLGDWEIVGRADINSDGIQDLIFQNNLGKIAGWFLDGTGTAVNFSTGAGLKPGSKTLYDTALTGWRIVDVADINGDGSPDFIFQNTSGLIAGWFLDGSGNFVDFSAGSGLKPGSKLLYGTALGDWKIAACADINGDGKNDLVFQNTAGLIAVWFLDGSGNAINFSTGAGLAPGARLLYPSSLGDWRVVDCSDVNNDGKTDFVFQNTARQIAVWFLDGTGNAVNVSTGAGLVAPGTRLVYASALGGWRIR